MNQFKSQNTNYSGHKINKEVDDLQNKTLDLGNKILKGKNNDYKIFETIAGYYGSALQDSIIQKSKQQPTHNLEQFKDNIKKLNEIIQCHNVIRNVYKQKETQKKDSGFEMK